MALAAWPPVRRLAARAAAVAVVRIGVHLTRLLVEHLKSPGDGFRDYRRDVPRGRMLPLRCVDVVCRRGFYVGVDQFFDKEGISFRACLDRLARDRGQRAFRHCRDHSPYILLCER